MGDRVRKSPDIHWDPRNHHLRSDPTLTVVVEESISSTTTKKAAAVLPELRGSFTAPAARSSDPGVLDCGKEDRALQCEPAGGISNHD